MIAEVAAVLAPVFVLAGLGYGWRLTGAPFDLPFVTRVIMYVAGPCLVFTSLSELSVPLSDFWGMVGQCVADRYARKPQRSIKLERGRQRPRGDRVLEELSKHERILANFRAPRSRRVPPLAIPTRPELS